MALRDISPPDRSRSGQSQEIREGRPMRVKVSITTMSTNVLDEIFYFFSF